MSEKNNCFSMESLKNKVEIKYEDGKATLHINGERIFGLLSFNIDCDSEGTVVLSMKALASKADIRTEI